MKRVSLFCWKNSNCWQNVTFADGRRVVVRFRTALRRRVRRLDSDAIRSITPGVSGAVHRFIETVAEADGRRHVAIACLVRRHHFGWIDSFGVNHFDDVDIALLGRRCSAFDLLATPWSILVVGMLLQVDHSQTFGFFYERSSFLWRETLPLFACQV